MYKASRQLAYSVVKFTIFIPLLLQWLVSAVSLTAFSLAIRQAWFHQTLLKYNMQQRSLAREQVTDIHQKSTFVTKKKLMKKQGNFYLPKIYFCQQKNLKKLKFEKN